MTPLHSVVTWFVSSSTNTPLFSNISQPARQPTPTTESDMTSSRERSLCFNLIVFIMIRLTHIVLLMIYHHLHLHLTVLQFLCNDMDNICAHCSKNTFTNKKALKRHADLCEIKSSLAPARKSSKCFNLYYDKVDAHGLINDISSSPSPPTGSCKVKSGPPRKSARTTTEPDQ